MRSLLFGEKQQDTSAVNVVVMWNTSVYRMATNTEMCFLAELDVSTKYHMWIRETCGLTFSVLRHGSKRIWVMKWLNPLLIWKDFSLHLIWLWHHFVCTTSQTQAAVSLPTWSWSCQAIRLISRNRKCPTNHIHMQHLQTLRVGTNVSPCGQQNFSFLRF